MVRNLRVRSSPECFPFFIFIFFIAVFGIRKSETVGVAHLFDWRGVEVLSLHRDCFYFEKKIVSISIKLLLIFESDRPHRREGMREKTLQVVPVGGSGYLP